MYSNGRIPVLGAVAAAYRFAFGRFLTVLRLSWFWVAVAVALTMLWGPDVLAATIAGLKAFKTGGLDALFEAMGAAGPQANILRLVSFLASVFVMVALLRAVISQDERPGVPLHLFSGMADLRVIGVAFLLLIGLIAGALAFLIVVSVLGAVLAPLGAGMVVGLLMIALVIVFFWVCLRLSLVVPVAAVESNLGVERSWELMKGNSLRMLAAILLTMIPFSIAFQAVAAAILGVQELTPLPTYDPKNANAFVAALADRGIEQLEFMQARFPAIVALSTVSGLLSQGLWAGLLGYAYRAATNMNQPAE